MRKLVVLGLGATLFGVMYVVGLIILAGVDDKFVIPTPHLAVVGGVLAMFATLGFFALGFVQSATQE